MKTVFAVVLVLSTASFAQQDAWKDQEAKTKAAISASEKALEGGSYGGDDYGGSSTPSPLLKLGKEHAEAVLKKQKQRLAAIEKGRALDIPAERSDRTRYSTHVRGGSELLIGGAWRPLQEGFPLVVGDRIRVAEGGLVSLWISGGFLTLDEKSEALIADSNAVALNGGRMHWENLTKGGDELQCRTPTVVATIKGTEFDMLLKGAESVFLPYSGTVELRSLISNVARRKTSDVTGGHSAAARSQNAEPDESRVESVIGSVTLVRGTNISPAHSGEGLEAGDVVETGHNSHARLALEGGFETELLPLTSFKIEKRSYSLIDGLAQVWTSMIRAGSEQDWSFRTPNAVAAVRGTSFKLGYSNETGRDEFVPETGVLEITAERNPKLDDAALWWNRD